MHGQWPAHLWPSLPVWCRSLTAGHPVLPMASPLLLFHSFLCLRPGQAGHTEPGPDGTSGKDVLMWFSQPIQLCPPQCPVIQPVIPVFVGLADHHTGRPVDGIVETPGSTNLFLRAGGLTLRSPVLALILDFIPVLHAVALSCPVKSEKWSSDAL